MPILPGPEDLGTQNPRAARGQPSYQASPVGRALQGFGQEIGSLGATLSIEQEKRKTELDKVEAFGVQSRLNEFETNWAKQVEERGANITPGGAGFSDKFTADYTQSAREFMGTVPEHLRPQVDVRLGNVLQSYAPNVQNFERTEAFRYGQEKVADGLNTMLTRLARDPAQSPQIEKEGIDLINSNPAYSPVQRDEAIRKWTTDHQVARFEINKTLNGAGEAEKLGVTPGGNVGSTGFLGAIARAEGTAGKGDYNAVLGLGKYGSPNRPLTEMTLAEAYAFGLTVRARHGKSSALGRYQIVGTTMRAMADRLGLDWETAKFDAATQDALATEIAKVQGLDAWEGFKGNPGEKDIARQYLNSGGGDTSELDAKVAAANKGANQGQGPTLDAVSRRTIVEPDPGYAKIDYSTRVKMYNDAIKTDQKEFTQKVEDYSSYLRSGGAPQEGFDTATLQKRLGPEAGQKVAAQLQQDAALGQDVKDVAFASPQETKQLLSDRMALLASPTDFKDNASNLATLKSAIDKRDAAIKADPATYTQLDPEVRSAYQKMQTLMSDPIAPIQQVITQVVPAAQPAVTPVMQQEAIKQYADSTLAMQTRLGVPPEDQRILPKPVATEIAAQFKRQPEGGQNAADQMRYLEAQWGQQWPKVFGQLVKDGDLPTAATVIGSMDRPDQQAAANRLAEAAAVGVKELKDTLLPTLVTEAEKAIPETLSPFAQTVGPSGIRTLNSVQDAVNLLALAYMHDSGATSAGASVERAYNDIIDKKYDIVGTYRTPKGAGDIVSRGAASAINKLTGPFLVEQMADFAGFGEPLTPAQLQSEYLQSIQSRGFWVTSPDESGLTLYNEQWHAVQRMDGSPVRMSWQELSDVGAGIPPAFPYLPSGATSRTNLPYLPGSQ